MHNNKQKGFTLVELLVVIAIIGLLSTIAVVSLGSARAKARDATRIADAKQISTALEQYYADNGGYPPAAAATGTALGVAATTNELSSTGFGTTATAPTYMALIPGYPTPPATAACAGSYATPTLTVNNFCYYTSSTSGNQTDYKLFYLLENTNTTLGGKACIYTSAGVSCS